MFPPFDEEKAFAVCKKIAALLDEKKLRMENVGARSEERMDNGVMIGAMTARDSSGAEKIFYTVSGISKRIEGNFPDGIFVEPVVGAEEISESLSQNDFEIHALTKIIGEKKSANEDAEIFLRRRNFLTTQSLQKVFALYSFHCADGKIRTLNEICKKKIGGKFPPTGTGDCAAVKLLNLAFKKKFTVESLCEIFYGKSSEQKIGGKKYSPCDERCGIVLPEILGLKILYRDAHIIVVDKQSGVLSVPGRTREKKDCIANRVKKIFPFCIEQPAVHRLDMETSGLMVLAFTKEAHRNLSRQFEEGAVKKNYVAILDGVLAKKGIASRGTMELFFRLDVENRPHQIWDDVHGKKSVTEWEILGVEKYVSPEGIRRDVTRVKFIPHTGRTHQLRLASADSHGFGVPIVGDTLYGKCEEGERLLLHAEYLSFVHPVTDEPMEFFCNAEF